VRAFAVVQTGSAIARLERRLINDVNRRRNKLITTNGGLGTSFFARPARQRLTQSSYQTALNYNVTVGPRNDRDSNTSRDYYYRGVVKPVPNNDAR